MIDSILTVPKYKKPALKHITPIYYPLPHWWGFNFLAIYNIVLLILISFLLSKSLPSISFILTHPFLLSPSLSHHLPPQIHSYSEWTQWRQSIYTKLTAAVSQFVLDPHFTSQCPPPSLLKDPTYRSSAWCLFTRVTDPWGVGQAQEKYYGIIQVIQLSKIVYYLLEVSSMSTSLIEGKLCCLVLFYPKTHEVWK